MRNSIKIMCLHMPQDYHDEKFYGFIMIYYIVKHELRKAYDI